MNVSNTSVALGTANGSRGVQARNGSNVQFLDSVLLDLCGVEAKDTSTVWLNRTLEVLVQAVGGGVIPSASITITDALNTNYDTTSTNISAPNSTLPQHRARRAPSPH